MRSPPMRHASLHANDETNSTPTNSKDLADYRDRRRSSITQGAAQLSVEAGHANPDELYWNVRDQRERRLRLLLRRYVNQILFGCQNRNCAVTTCLSYRKRNCKGPLRHYTDLSARALACHLLEEYSQPGKDPSQGLCQSPPVVPWFEDPTTRPRRRHSTKSTPPSTTQLNGHTPEDVKHSLARTTRQSSSTEAHPNAESNVGDVAQGCIALNDTTPELQPQRTSGRGGEDVPIHHDEQGTEEVQEQPEVTPPARKKDLASFVQSLWDTLSLRTLFIFPTHSANPIPSSDLQPDQRRLQEWSDRPDIPVDLRECEDLEHASTSACDFTLQRLSWKTLTWFLEVHNEKSTQSTPFEKFLRHNLYYNLSNPLRLYRSALSWNDDQDERESPHNEAESVSDESDRHEKQSHGDEAGLPSTLLTNGATHENRERTRRTFDINRSLQAYDRLTTLGDGTDGVYSALHTTIQQCYTLGFPRPLSCTQQVQLGLKSFKRSGGGIKPVRATFDTAFRQVMEKSHVAEIFLSVLMASLMPLFSEDMADAGFNPINLSALASLRNDNRAYPVIVYRWSSNGEEDLITRQLHIDVIDHFEDWHLLRLTASLMDCLSHHLAAGAIRRNRRPSLLPGKLSRNVIEIMLDRLCEGLPEVESGTEIEFRAIIGLGIIELARSVLLKEWDREPVIKRTSAVGGALELLAAVYRRSHSFYVGDSLFHMEFIPQAFDEMELPLQWQSFQPNGKEMHILSFSFLFEPAMLVKYFRSANVNTMRRAHESATAYNSDARQFLGNTIIPVYGGKEVLSALRPHMAKFLVLTIRRSNILEDAMNQLWRRQRREILRPLRVRLGKDEGEDGLDHGGVQQEFFRLVFAEAFLPEYGMFTVDNSTHMTWFQPGSLEPLYKFEALGILMSLAVYNAVTLPITFPLAFYRKLLGLKVKKLEHFQNGWPDLARGLEGLLAFEGDVAEVIARTYEFSYELAGTTVSVDMQKHGRDDPWPVVERTSRKGKDKTKSTTFELPVQLDITPPSQSPPTAPLSRTSSLKGISTPLSLDSEAPEEEEAATVSNDTRDQYVKDYIFWLTDKSIRPQFEAFHRGFLTCLDPTALSMFTPHALQEVMEGHRDIDINELEATATYEEFEKDSEYMKLFWQVVRSFSKEQHRQLLEFVTASDRVPVNGLESIQFIVQKNGDDDGRLPSSSTCYGRLLLPQYTTRAVLEEKLGKALENSLGFGAL